MDEVGPMYHAQYVPKHRYLPQVESGIIVQRTVRCRHHAQTPDGEGVKNIVDGLQQKALDRTGVLQLGTVRELR